jgi:hypothetical protein
LPVWQPPQHYLLLVVVVLGMPQQLAPQQPLHQPVNRLLSAHHLHSLARQVLRTTKIAGTELILQSKKSTMLVESMVVHWS